MGGPRRGLAFGLAALLTGSLGLAIALPAPALADGPLAGRTIVLNPEEGGDDSGGIVAGVEEKNINLPTTLATGALLSRAGAHVVFTRSTDVSMTLAARAAVANQAHADAFVTIAANTMDDPSVSGAITFYGGLSGYLHDHTRPATLVAPSRDLARAIQAGVIQATGEVDRGVQSADFYVLGYAAMPSVLIEAGFMSNPAELQRLVTPAYQETIAEGIASGLAQYFSGQPAASAHAGTPYPAVPDATYVSDVTYPDHTSVPPGQALTKTWQVTNTGTAPWADGYRLVLQPGATIQAQPGVPLPAASTGQTVNLSVAVSVPATAGVATGTWRLTAPDGQSFGDPLTIVVDVAGATFRPFWVETTQATSLWSDATGAANAIQKLGQWSYLQVTQPPQGSRLAVKEPSTTAAGFVDAGTVGPSGAPPAGYTPPPVTPPFTPFWVETTQATSLYSAVSAPAVTFGKVAQWSPLLVLAPQAGARLYVRNPATNGSAYVDAGMVGPSGPPAGPTPVAAPPVAPPPAALAPVSAGPAPSYVVRPGDTLSGIAVRFHVSAAAIASANGIADENAIVAGQTLRIPGGTPPFAPFWVENFVKTPVWSGSDAQAKQFGIAALFTPMQVLAPATNGRYLVRVWPADGQAYVDASAVGPAGAPSGA